MATIKTYTDLEQSKKLAEILPLESADMFYDGYKNVLNDDEISYQIDTVSNWTAAYPNKSLFEKSDDTTIPCWSLAALLELLPKRLEIEDNVYELGVYLYGLYYCNIINGNLCFKSKDKDNLVDACYEMILKLNELKML